MMNTETTQSMGTVSLPNHKNGISELSLSASPIPIAITGVNQDGKTAGITLPSGKAQARLMRSVYNAVGLNPAHTASFQ